MKKIALSTLMCFITLMSVNSYAEDNCTGDSCVIVYINGDKDKQVKTKSLLDARLIIENECFINVNLHNKYNKSEEILCNKKSVAIDIDSMIMMNGIALSAFVK